MISSHSTSSTKATIVPTKSTASIFYRVSKRLAEAVQIKMISRLKLFIHDLTLRVEAIPLCSEYTTSTASTPCNDVEKIIVFAFFAFCLLLIFSTRHDLVFARRFVQYSTRCPSLSLSLFPVVNHPAFLSPRYFCFLLFSGPVWRSCLCHCHQVSSLGGLLSFYVFRELGTGWP